MTNTQAIATPWWFSFWKFSRPHTIVGTSCSVFGLYAIALANAFGGLSFAAIVASSPSLVIAGIACLCGNIYIVGLNQIEDIEIDKINKPHLPLAAGEYTLQQGRAIVTVAGICSLVLSWMGGFWLFATVATSVAIGTAYSLPPIRLKRFPFWASFCIFTVRGAIVNLGLYLAYAEAYTKIHTAAVRIPANVWLLTTFVLGFTFAIAIFKDIPDMEGDRKYNIRTFTLQLGAQAVFKVGCWVVSICYFAIAAVSFIWTTKTFALWLTLFHAIAIVSLFWRGKNVAPENKREMASFYQFIWKLFFLEYFLFPAACFLA